MGTPIIVSLAISGIFKACAHERTNVRRQVVYEQKRTDKRNIQKIEENRECTAWSNRKAGTFHTISASPLSKHSIRGHTISLLNVRVHVMRPFAGSS